MDARMQAFIDRTWQDYGRKIRPLRKLLVVRTLPTEQRVGSLWLPPTAASLYGPLAHQRQVKAIVLAAGPQATVKPGEVIAFTRLYFGYWHKYENDCYLGWIDENQVSGYVDEDVHLI